MDVHVCRVPDIAVIDGDGMFGQVLIVLFCVRHCRTKKSCLVYVDVYSFKML